MIIDAHMHLPTSVWPHREDYFTDVHASIDYFIKCGIDIAVFTPWQGVLAHHDRDIDQANQEALKLYQTYPQRLLPGVSLHPAYPQQALDWLSRFHDQGLMWVGELVHYQHEILYDDPRFMKLFEYCARNGHIVQLHNHEAILTVAQHFPDMTIIWSHIPDQQSLERMAEMDNIYLDISGGVGGLYMGGIEKALAVLGPQRLLFGTDFTSYDPACFIQRVKTDVPDNTQRQQIFSENILRLIQLEHI